MCLAIPGRIVEILASTATVDFSGITRAVRLDLLPDAKPGEYVLVHAGFAIQRLDSDEALEVLSLFEEASASATEVDP